MADFFLSDTDEESAVDELISQVKDLSTLEQISKINCSSFSDSFLPSHLEARFSKLKSFPQTHHTSKFTNSKQNSDEPESEKPKYNSGSSSFSPPSSNSSSLNVKQLSFEKQVDERKIENPKLQSDLSSEMENFSTSKRSSLKKKSGNGSSLSSSNSSRDSRSPPRGMMGCLWCSPKRVSKKKSRDKWRGGDEILSDLGVFSENEQKRILKKTMKEQEAVNREADKIVKWAKQASARMEILGVEDDMVSDDERHS